jgi:hypothetical protein
VVYHPSVLATLIAWGGLAGLPWLALQLDRRLKARVAATILVAREAVSASRLISPRQLGWLAALAIPLLHFILPRLIVEALHWPAWALFGILLLSFGAVLQVVRLLQGRLSPQHSFALLAGSQGFWVVGGLIAQLDNANRPDNTAGMGLVAAALLAFIIGCALLLKQRQKRLQLATLKAV